MWQISNQIRVSNVDHTIIIRNETFQPSLQDAVQDTYRLAL